MYLLGLLLALGFSALLYLYRQKNAGLSRRWAYALFLLRSLSFFLAFILLCDLYFKLLQKQQEKPLLLVAADNSSSMRLSKDSTAVRDFFTHSWEPLKEKLGAKFELEFMRFGERLDGSGKTPEFMDLKSDFESHFHGLSGNYGNRNVAALVLISDGIANSGSRALNTAANLGYPVYCVATGDSTVLKDISLEKVIHNEVVYKGNDFPVELQVNALMARGESAWVVLKDQQRELGKQKLQISSDHFATTVQFTLQALETGLNRYKVIIEQLKGEKNTKNNLGDFVVEVQDKRQNILLMASAPHPDVSALRESILSQQSYSLECAFSDRSDLRLEQYNLVLFHGAGPEQAQQINFCREHKIPFWLIAPRSGDLFPGMRLNGSNNRFNDCEPLLNPNFNLFNLRPELAAFIAQSPAVRCQFGRYVLSNSATSLVYQKIGAVESSEPLFVFNENDGHKTACFNGDGLWRWKMRDFAEKGNSKRFEELISSTIFYLAVKADKSQFRLRYPPIISEMETLEIEAELYNKSYETV